MPTATILNSTGTRWGTSSYSNSGSPFTLGKTTDYTCRGRFGFAALNPAWYIKSIKLYMNRTDTWAGRTLKVGTSLSSAWGAPLDWSVNIYASKGTGAKSWDLTAYKGILQAYGDAFYFHLMHGSGDSSYCEWTAGSGSGAPRLVVEYEEATLTVPGGEFTIGTASAITVGIAGSGLTHVLSYSIGTASGALNGGASITAGDTVNWTPDAALANQITDAMVGTVTMTLESYLDGVLSSTVTRTYPLNVPASYVPAIGSAPSFAVGNPTGDEIGIYVQGRSWSVCTISASSVYGASIVEYRLTIGGKTYTSFSSPITTDVLTATGALGATVAVVDSRGQTATVTLTAAVTVYAYFAPRITSFSLARALADGTVSNEGTYIKFTLSCVFAPLANKNTRAGSIKFKVAGGTYSVAVSMTDAMTALGVVYSFSLTGVLGGGFIGSGSYVVSATLADRYTTSSAEADLASRKIYFDLHSSGEGVAIGKVADTASLFDVGLDSRFDGVVSFGESGRVGSRNVLFNPYFLASAAGWTVGTNVARDLTRTLDGAVSIKSQQSGLAADSYRGPTLQAAYCANCAVGDAFAFSAYVYLEDSALFDRPIRVVAVVKNASSVDIQYGIAELVPTAAHNGKWTRLAGRLTVTAANAAKIGFTMYPLRNGTAWFACPKLERNGMATEFVANVDGDVRFNGAVGFAEVTKARNALGIYDGAVSFSVAESASANFAITYTDYNGAAVTLPAAPRVQAFAVVTGGGGAPDSGNKTVELHAYNVTNTGFMVRVMNQSTWDRSGTLNWIAHQV